MFIDVHPSSNIDQVLSAVSRSSINDWTRQRECTCLIKVLLPYGLHLPARGILVTDLWNSVFTLPKVIRQIVSSLFYSAPEFSTKFNSCVPFLRLFKSPILAWFPVPFLHVDDLYKHYLLTATRNEDYAIRISYPILFCPTLTYCLSLLPAFVAEAVWASFIGSELVVVASGLRGMQIHLVTMWAISHLAFAGCMFATLCYVLAVV